MDDISQFFPFDSYNFINSAIYKYDNYVKFYFELIFFENTFAALCMKISIMEYNPNQAFICLEINLNKFLNEINFHNPDSFDFGIIYYDSYNNLIPLTYGRKDIFEDIKEVFNDTVSKNYIIDEKRRTFDLFHFLYYNVTKIAKEHPELKVNFTEIEEEYKATKDEIIKGLIEYDKKREVDKIIITFTKTICRKRFVSNNFECVKDDFEIIIIPIFFKVNKMNEDYLEMDDDIGSNFNMYIFSILSTNPASNKLKIATILKFKLMRTIALFFFFLHNNFGNLLYFNNQNNIRTFFKSNK